MRQGLKWRRRWRCVGLGHGAQRLFRLRPIIGRMPMPRRGADALVGRSWWWGGRLDPGAEGVEALAEAMEGGGEGAGAGAAEGGGEAAGVEGVEDE